MDIKQKNRGTWEKLYGYRETVIGSLRKRFYKYYGKKSASDICDESMKKNVGYELYEADYENIFHDAILFINNNTQSGKIKLEDVSCSSTYITRVCIYKMQELLRRKKNEINYSKFIQERYKNSIKSSFLNEKVETLISLSPESKYFKTEKESIIKNMVLNMPSPCNDILHGYYWEEKSIKELADTFYKGSENATKVTKHRCLEKFRCKYIEQIKKGGLYE